MDPELRAHLDGIPSVIGSLRQELHSEVSGLREELGAVETRLGAEIETRVLPKIELVAEGVASLREQVDRRFDEYHRDLMSREIGPIKALAVEAIRRLDGMEHPK
jgi:hypothetical protein